MKTSILHVKFINDIGGVFRFHVFKKSLKTNGELSQRGSQGEVGTPKLAGGDCYKTGNCHTP